MTWLWRAAIVFALVVVVACIRVKPPDTGQRHDASPVATRREEPPLPPVRPNILLISLDTLRYDATGLAPQGSNRTPFLRQLAANGVEFTRSYSTFDSTRESHFSMLTGFVSG